MSIQSLSSDLLKYFFSSLDPLSLHHLGNTCRNFRQIGEEIWKIYCERDCHNPQAVKVWKQESWKVRYFQYYTPDKNIREGREPSRSFYNTGFRTGSLFRNKIFYLRFDSIVVLDFRIPAFTKEIFGSFERIIGIDDREGKLFFSSFSGSDSSKREIKIWDAETCNFIGDLATVSGKISASLVVQGRVFTAINHSQKGQIRIWDAKTLKSIGEVDLNQPVETLYAHRNYLFLLSGVGNKEIEVYDIEKKELVKKLGESVSVYVANGRIYNFCARKEKTEGEAESSIRGKVLEVWDAEKLSLINTIESSELKNFNLFSWSSGMDKLFMASNERKMLICDLKSLALVKEVNLANYLEVYNGTIAPFNDLNVQVFSDDRALIINTENIPNSGNYHSYTALVCELNKISSVDEILEEAASLDERASFETPDEGNYLNSLVALISRVVRACFFFVKNLFHFFTCATN